MPENTAKSPARVFRSLRRLAWPRGGLRGFPAMLDRALRRKTAPHSIALGMAAGAFASALPFLGLHMAIAALLAWAIGGNLVAAVIGTWVGNPFSFPFIWFAAFESGHYLLGTQGDFAALTMSWSALGEILWPMTIGGSVVGLGLAGLTYAATLWGVGAYQRGKANA